MLKALVEDTTVDIRKEFNVVGDVDDLIFDSCDVTVSDR